MQITRKQAKRRRQFVAQLYTKHKRTLQEIADQLGVSRERVRQLLAAEGVERRHKEWEAWTTHQRKSIVLLWHATLSTQTTAERLGLGEAAVRAYLSHVGALITDKELTTLKRERRRAKFVADLRKLRAKLGRVPCLTEAARAILKLDSATRITVYARTFGMRSNQTYSQFWDELWKEAGWKRPRYYGGVHKYV